ncbi:TPA: hypothetical protein N0F65_008683 [Lagenidium giganteum]|uniref:Vacuolar protein 8 n=1 Tax=Lagenidium giganteum TaxID=4803 RepID=A0AAV2Z8X3_9STRA|nr:TPA: hypothetical protein N0F65_008683 [Lagenidium giganteum]
MPLMLQSTRPSGRIGEMQTFALTSPPPTVDSSGVSSTTTVRKRQWNRPPTALQPPTQSSSSSSSSKTTHVTPRRSAIREPPASMPQQSVAERPRPASAAATSSRRSIGISSSTSSSPALSRMSTASLLPADSLYGGGKPVKKSVFITSLPPTSEFSMMTSVAPTRGGTTSKVPTSPRLSQANAVAAGGAKKKNTAFADDSEGGHAAASSALAALANSQHDVQLRKSFYLTSVKKQDVDADDIRPLIEIAYWSPFLEVRRDAAAALASLTRNGANLELLSQLGTLGALISMLNSSEDRIDPSIARDAALALAAMVKLQSVKLKLLQAPDGIECIFSLLHSTDMKLRRTAFEIINNLVTVEDLRQAVAKREGFAYMLDSCTSKDSRIRCLAATILHQLALCRENRFLFYHSTHFQTLADILHDPFMEKDFQFRRELLSFIHLLVVEEENGRKFVELNLIPTMLSILDSPKTNLQICLLVVSILEALAINRKNHSALLAAEALPRIVHLCFCSNRGVHAVAGESRKTVAALLRRPRTAGSGRNSVSSSIVGSARSRVRSSVFTTIGLEQGTSTSVSGSVVGNAANASNSLLSSEINAILRPAFMIFCEMAKNPVNREHIIRSKLVDYIASKNLYASSDKRVRRSVITLLTFLICKEREREKRTPLRDESSRTVLGAPDKGTAAAVAAASATATATAQANGLHPMWHEAEYKHYIELLARGIVKCLFGILHGNDFSMKVDAIGAIAQLTEDENSRITMCKPQLLHALKEFAFHPLVQTRFNIAKIIANFAERPENALKLVDEGMLAILVKYVCPISRNNEVLYEATRAIAALSMVHVTRGKLVECGVLGTLIQFCKAASTSPQVHAYALTAIRNLRHDAAALRIQAIYRGWHVRIHHARSIIQRKRRVKKMTSMRIINHNNEKSIASVMERFVAP